MHAPTRMAGLTLRPLCMLTELLWHCRRTHFVHAQCMPLLSVLFDHKCVCWWCYCAAFVIHALVLCVPRCSAFVLDTVRIPFWYHRCLIYVFYVSLPASNLNQLKLNYNWTLFSCYCDKALTLVSNSKQPEMSGYRTTEELKSLLLDYNFIRKREQQ